MIIIITTTIVVATNNNNNKTNNSSNNNNSSMTFIFPVDVLGGVLKKRVSQLRQQPRQEVDLVFLVDSSASVGSDNFYNEIKFIRKVSPQMTSQGFSAASFQLE